MPNPPEPFRMSTDRWPLVELIVTDDMKDADISAMFQAWEAVLTRQKKFVSVTDVRSVRSRADAKQRARIAAWTQQISSRILAYSLGSAIVVDNSLIRGALTAIDWIHKPPVPQTYFSKMLDAYDWAIEQLEQGGVEVTPAIRALRDAEARRRA